MTSYDDINNTKAIYSNISIDDIRTHYTLWSEEGQKKWYVYKCKVKWALNNFGKTFKRSSWIMMSPGLHNQEGQLNNNWYIGFTHLTINAINRKIYEMKEILRVQKSLDDKETTPLWYEASENYINEKVKEYKLQLSIGSIINKVKDILLASQGDIISIVDVVRNLNIEGMFNFAKSIDKKRVVKSSTDIDGVNVYILFDYTQNISDSNYKLKKVFGVSKKKIHIEGHYYIFKPKNKAAIDKCKKLLNCKISDLIQNATNI
tara:strand:- start:349 stop:1131 length:783 start_codon:yes stop_codon:yes gene_type:complete